MEYLAAFMVYTATAAVAFSETESSYHAPPPPPLPSSSSGYASPPASDWFSQPSEYNPTSTSICKTITMTTTRTVSVITKIPSSLTSITGDIDLSSFMAPQPPTSSFMDVISCTLSSYKPPPAPEPSASASDIVDSSSLAPPPEVPNPTVTTPIELTTTILPSSLMDGDTTTEIVVTDVLPTSNETLVVPTGTGVSGTPGLPVFTDAAEAVRVPAALIGVIGWAVLVL